MIKKILCISAREHFIAHWLLWRIYRNRQSAFAFSSMRRRNKKQKRYVISLIGELEARECLMSFKGNKNNFFGKKHSEKSKFKMSIAQKK